MTDTADPRTIAFYDRAAPRYAAKVGQIPSQALRRFITALPAGAQVLDLGCGPGHASAHMAAAGLAPDPVDASPAMVDLARAQGLPARQMRFDQLAVQASYDGVWAHFSLTHAPTAALAAHLSAIARALRPGGLFHITMKTGSGPMRDRLGRLYHLIPAERLRHMLGVAGFTIADLRTGTDTGFDDRPMSFAVATCHSSPEPEHRTT